MSAARAEAPRARLHLTGAGGWGIATCLAIAAAAANTANNLLYLLLALMLAAYVVSAWSSRRTLMRLSAEIVAPAEVRRREPAAIVASLTAGGRAPAIILELRAKEAASGLESRSVRSLPVVEEGVSSVAMDLLPARRGPAHLTLTARSPFPFGLFDGFRKLACEEILVLPSSDPGWRRAVRDSASVGRSEGRSVQRKGDGTEIFNIRSYAWGEDARRMDWKATARLDRPMLREYAREQERAVVLVLPELRPPESAGDERLEIAISQAAGAATELEREGWQLRLLAPGCDVRGDARAILRALARLQPGGELAAEGWWRSRVRPGESVLAFEAPA